MGLRQDYRCRRSFSYKMKRWFWSNHTEEIKMVFKLIGEFIVFLLLLGIIFILPHIFH